LPLSPSVLYTLSLHDALPICLTFRQRCNPAVSPTPEDACYPAASAPLRKRPQKGSSPDRSRCRSPPPCSAAVRTPRSPLHRMRQDRKSTRLNSSHLGISYAVF